MGHYYLMAIKQGSNIALKELLNYYAKSTTDYTFLDLHNYEFNEEYRAKVLYLIDEKLKPNVSLPRKYHFAFCQWKFQNQIVSKTVMMKQYILKKTNLWPSNYSSKYLVEFMEVLLLSNMSCRLPKDVMILIAGYCFL